MMWHLGGKQSQPRPKGKQEEEKKEVWVFVSFFIYLPRACSGLRIFGLFDSITAYWEIEGSEISQEPSFMINFQYLLSEEMSWQKQSS